MAVTHDCHDPECSRDESHDCHEDWCPDDEEDDRYDPDAEVKFHRENPREDD